MACKFLAPKGRAADKFREPPGVAPKHFASPVVGPSGGQRFVDRAAPSDRRSQ